MKTNTRKTAASRFNELTFHDDNLATVMIHPPQTRTNRTRIDFTFAGGATGRKKLLSFIDCTDFRFVVDFDVLAENWLAQTSSSVAKVEFNQRKKFVRSQRRHWNVRYMPPMPKGKPIKGKLVAIRNYVRFTVMFFGGTAEILEKNYKLSRKP